MHQHSPWMHRVQGVKRMQQRRRHKNCIKINSTQLWLLHHGHGHVAWKETRKASKRTSSSWLLTYLDFFHCSSEIRALKHAVKLLVNSALRQHCQELNDGSMMAQSLPRPKGLEVSKLNLDTGSRLEVDSNSIGRMNLQKVPGTLENRFQNFHIEFMHLDMCCAALYQRHPPQLTQLWSKSPRKSKSLNFVRTRRG